MELTIEQLAKELDATLVASGGKTSLITAVGPIEKAELHEVTFVNHDKYIAAVRASRAGAVIVKQVIPELSIPQLVVKHVDAAIIKALELFAPEVQTVSPGVDPSARIGKQVQLAGDVCIGPYVVIEDGVTVGAHTAIHAGCSIGYGCRIGTHCRLDSHVVVYHHCTIGDHVIIQANSTIGAVGFGYATIDGVHRCFPHNGGVIIEDFVEIGANCCIDRAKFKNTIVGAGTKMDNFVQIGHNVVIGKGCLISAQVGISGSCQLGDGVVLGGQVGIADNIILGDGTMVGAQSGVMSNTEPGQRLLWSPAMDFKQAFRVIAEIQRLPQITRQLKKVTKRLEQLEATNND